MEKPGGKGGDGLLSSSIDRISDLPQPILHHILCFLSQSQAVQTCVLSKSWRRLWCTRPNIELCQHQFQGNTRTFLSIFDQTLQRYHHQNISINQLVVKMSIVYLESTLLLEKWIPVALMNLGVETFHLIFPQQYYPYYDLPSPQTVFGAEFLKELYLEGCKISSADGNLCLKHLQTLSLKRIHINDETFAKIIASCPLIKRVELDRCIGLTTVKVNSLKHFGCLFSSSNIEIKVPSALETIKVMSCLNWYMYCSNNHYIPHVKSVYLSDVHLSKEFFSSFSCSSPFLEDFELRSCSGFKEVKIFSSSVKRLIIVDTKKQIETITVDAPDIVYFEFSCPSSVSSTSLPSVSFATVASREWKSNISVPFQLQSSDIDILPWFFELNEVLKALRQSRITLNLFCDSLTIRHTKKINYVGSYEPVVLEDLNLKDFASSDDFGALFNCLFRIFRPRYIYMKMYLNPQINKLAEFIWKTKHKDGEFSQCYFWQQELKELRLELLDHDSKKWCLVPESRLSVVASPEIQVLHSIRFVFNWSESVLLA